MLLVVYYRNLASRHAALSSDDFAPYECSSNDYQTTIIWSNYLKLANADAINDLTESWPLN